MKNVSKSAVCKTCHKRLNKQEMVFYIDGYYCPKCYQERISRETFSRYVCELFNLKAPGPRIWKQRKRLREKYGYDDETGDDRFNEYGIPYGDDFDSDPIYLADREVSV